MQIRYRCAIYPNRAEHCSQYPWCVDPETDRVPEQCQWMEDGYLVPKGELKKLPEDIEVFCVMCGRCCFNWDQNKRIHSALQTFFHLGTTFKDTGEFFFVEFLFYPVVGEELMIAAEPNDAPDGEKVRARVIDVPGETAQMVVLEKAE